MIIKNTRTEYFLILLPLIWQDLKVFIIFILVLLFPVVAMFYTERLNSPGFTSLKFRKSKNKSTFYNYESETRYKISQFNVPNLHFGCYKKLVIGSGSGFYNWKRMKRRLCGSGVRLIFIFARNEIKEKHVINYCFSFVPGFKKGNNKYPPHEKMQFYLFISQAAGRCALDSVPILIRDTCLRILGFTGEKLITL